MHPKIISSSALSNQALPEKVKMLLEASVAPETRRAYRSRLKKFLEWCQGEGIAPPIPSDPINVAAYLADLYGMGRSEAYVEQSCAAIAAAHRALGESSPLDSLVVKKAIKGFKRLNTKAPKPKAAATADIVKQIVLAIKGDRPSDIRDRAVIALGFAGAFRRGELSALNIEDLQWITQDGQNVVLVRVARSKTDQEGKGFTKAIFQSDCNEVDPYRLLRQWLETIDRVTGPVFTKLNRAGNATLLRLSPQSIRLILQQRAKNADLGDMDLSAHSLRSGFVTTAIRNGATERSIMNQTGHRSERILRGYYQRENAVEDNAARNIL